MKINVFVLIVVIFFSCESQKRETNTSPEADEMMLVQPMSGDRENAPASKTLVNQTVIPADGRKLIKSGSISFETTDLEKSKTQIETICKMLRGYVANENGGSYDDRLYYEQHIRVPSAEFETFISKVEKIAPRLDSKNIISQDVTEEFVDIEARLKAKKELERRYLELLQMAKTVEDMLSIETQVGNVRAEIESMEGRLNVIKNKISFSAITISYYQLTGVDFGFTSKFIYALKKGWENLLNFFIEIINAWPFLILSAFIFYLIMKYKHVIFPKTTA